MDREKILKDIQSEDADLRTDAASLLSSLEFNHDDLIEYLKSDNIQLKNMALFKIKTLQNEEDARVLFSCLVDNPSEVRELASFVVVDFFAKEELSGFFQKKEFVEVLKRNMLDVNPNVCRNMLEIIESYEFKEELLDSLLEVTDEFFELTKEKSKKKNHRYNKYIFHLYWSLFAISLILKKTLKRKVNLSKVIYIVEKAQQFNEYTIREKGALLLKSILNIELNPDDKKILKGLKEKYLNDENFYVREIFNF